MKRRKLRPAERRVLALLVLAGVLASAYWLLIGSWFTGPLATMAERRSELQQEQQRSNSLLQRETQVLHQLQQRNAHQPQDRSLLGGTDPSLAAATLISRIQAVVKDSSLSQDDCELTESTPITTDVHPEEPYLGISASLTLKCRIKPLATILQAIESRPPWLFVDHFSVARREGIPASGSAGKLDVQLVVKAYMRRAPTTAKSTEAQ